MRTNPPCRHLKRIAIDEIYVGKRGYLTVVLDVLSGVVVFVGEGKAVKRWNHSGKNFVAIQTKLKIEAAAIDMSPA